MPKMLKFYKDKEKARINRNNQRRKNYRKTAFAPKSGQFWSPYEDKIILEHATTDFEISQMLQRSVSSIQTRRARLKKKDKKMLSDKVIRKIHYMNYHRLEKLANWLTNRYWQKDIPELAKYIIVRHYHWEEAKAGVL